MQHKKKKQVIQNQVDTSLQTKNFDDENATQSNSKSNNPFLNPNQKPHNPFLPISKKSTEIQKEALNGVELKKQIGRDAALEQLAHKYVYQDVLSPQDHADLANLGFKANPLIKASQSLEMQVFVPIGDRAKEDNTPVLAFRGTKGFADIMHDVNLSGVGIGQFRINQEIIGNILRSLNGKVDVTGHSLGGALAQITGVEYAHFVRRIVTFQSPGIPNHLVKKLEKHNEKAEKAIESTHYRVKNDLVDKAGEASTSGRVYEFAPGLNPLKAHSHFPLEALEKAKDEELAAMRIKSGKTNAPNTFRPAETGRVVVGGMLLGVPLAGFGFYNEAKASLNEDNEVRKWVKQQTMDQIGKLPADEKIRMIKILISGWTSEDDFSAIVKICRSVGSGIEMKTLRDALLLESNRLFGFQKKTLILELSRI